MERMDLNDPKQAQEFGVFVRRLRAGLIGFVSLAILGRGVVFYRDGQFLLALICAIGFIVSGAMALFNVRLGRRPRIDE